MTQKPLPLAAEAGRAIQQWMCAYCLDAVGVFPGETPNGWGNTRTGKLACRQCKRAIETFEAELVEERLGPLPGSLKPPADGPLTRIGDVVTADRSLAAPIEPPEEPC